MVYIKNFEEFSLLNESFQSSKLRNILNKYGDLKYPWEKKLLHTIEDDDILDCLDMHEYREKYPFSSTYDLQLNNGKVIVLGSIGGKGSDSNDVREFAEMLIDRKKVENTGDTIHAEHLKNVENLEKNRLLDNIRNYSNKLSKDIDTFINGIDIYSYMDDDSGTEVIESDGDISSVGGYNFGASVKFSYELLSSTPNYIDGVKESEDNEYEVDILEIILFEENGIEFDAIDEGIYKGKTKFRI